MSRLRRDGREQPLPKAHDLAFFRVLERTDEVIAARAPEYERIRRDEPPLRDVALGVDELAERDAEAFDRALVHDAQVFAIHVFRRLLAARARSRHPFRPVL